MGERFHEVVDLGRQEPAVLEADLARRPLEMDVDPAVRVGTRPLF